MDTVSYSLSLSLSALSSMAEDEVIASLTNAQEAACERCSECPIQGKHHFVKSKDSSTSKRICGGCYQHYKGKNQRRTMTNSTGM